MFGLYNFHCITCIYISVYLCIFDVSNTFCSKCNVLISYFNKNSNQSKLSECISNTSAVELVWSQVKRPVAENNTEFNMSLMEGLINNGIAYVTEQWMTTVIMLKLKKKTMWNGDCLQDDVQPPIGHLTSSESWEEMEGITEM